MITGHTSHQIGLDADIWLTPMPDRILTPQEREDITATSMLKDPFTVDPSDLDAAAYQADQARRVLSAGRAHLRASRRSRRCSASRPARTGPGSARCVPGGTTTTTSMSPHLPARCGRVREPETGERRRRLRQGARQLVLDAAQGGAIAVGATRRRLDAKPAPKKPPLGLGDLPTECTAVLNSGGGVPAIAADGTVPAALKAEAGKDAGPPAPNLDPVALAALKASMSSRSRARRPTPAAKPADASASAAAPAAHPASTAGPAAPAAQPSTILDGRVCGDRPTPCPCRIGSRSSASPHLASEAQ